MRTRRDGRRSDREPSTEALAAMAEAARRSRQSGVGVEGPTTRESGKVPAMDATGAAGAPAGEDHWRGRSLLIVSAALVAVLAAVVGWTSTNDRGTSARPAESSAPASRPAPVAGSSSTIPPVKSAPSSPPPSTPPASTTTSLAPAATTLPSGGGPVLATVEPSSGAAGQVVVITGSDFISPSGQISAHFGTQVTTIVCPEQTSCLVAVPPAVGTGASAPLTVTTDGGTSNPLTFTYG